MNERVGGEVWTVDPDASLQSVLDDPFCPPPLRRALTGVHSWQVRNETSVRRTLRASQLMPQWIAALLALGATVTVDVRGRSEEVQLDALITREVKGEVTALHIPTLDADSAWGEAHVARTPSDEPIVAAWAVLRVKSETVEVARVALIGVWSGAVRLTEAADGLIGEFPSRDRIGDVAAAVESEVEPVGDYLGSEAYRRAMANVLTRRALESCLKEVADE
jgi:CO/xanthine dehydrogenase FAD-binding subunit